MTMTSHRITWQQLDAIAESTGVKFDPCVYSVSIGKEDPVEVEIKRRERVTLAEYANGHDRDDK